MPCNSITTQSIKLANAMPELIEKALQEDGWTITINVGSMIQAKKSINELMWEKGKGIKITGRNNERHLKSISQAYSKQAISWAAKRAGWQVTNTNQNQLSLTRR